MRINEYVKKKRIEKGISDLEFASIVGENIHWVGDFDDDEEELNGLSIPQFKEMCRALGVSPVDIFSIVTSDLRKLNLPEMIRKRREEKYWSMEDLADRIGYETYIIESIENNTNLNKICIDALKKIAIELELPLDLVLEKL